MTRKTKIIATVGPSVNSKDGIKKLVEAGADVLRLNFSHGTEEDHSNVVKWIRELEKSVAIMQDIQGPKIRTGEAKESTQAFIEIIVKSAFFQQGIKVISFIVTKI